MNRIWLEKQDKRITRNKKTEMLCSIENKRRRCTSREEAKRGIE